VKIVVNSQEIQNVIAFPTVTVGVPTWNNESTILTTLNSLAGQSYENLIVIVSNDCSTDQNTQIIKGFAANHNNFIVINQKKNLGLYQNMAFCAEMADSKYFMWLAGDDHISSDFIKNNVNFLESNPEYIASSSLPVFLRRDRSEIGYAIDLRGDLLDRLRNFFRYANWSHNVFYSIFKTEIVKNFKFLGAKFAAADWAFDLYLLSLGKIKTDTKGHIYLGTNGVSRSTGANRKFLNGRIDFLFPMWPLMKNVLRLSGFGFRARLILIGHLMRLNFTQLKVDIVYIRTQIKSKVNR
jgi:glycosyltransferase involved in cell wall biosynthesis